MIVKITFDNGDIVLFGNSYKTWYIQFEEYFCLYKRKITPIKFESCKDKWIGWNGLKWCSADLFQNELNREGCQDNEPDNPNPRRYEDMTFVDNNLVKNKVMSILKRKW